jgi:hypothetical protein
LSVPAALSVSVWLPLAMMLPVKEPVVLDALQLEPDDELQVSVMFWPTVWVAALALIEFAIGAVPESATAKSTPPEGIVNEPVSAPALTGASVTDAVQPAAGARVAPQVLVCEKFAEAESCPSVIVLTPEFVIVTVFAGPVEPTATLAIDNNSGAMSIHGPCSR